MKMKKKKKKKGAREVEVGVKHGIESTTTC